MTRVVSIRIRNRAAAALVMLALVGVGAVFLTVGFALLLGVAATGAVVGTGLAAYRAIRGTRSTLGPGTRTELQGRMNARLAGLDPSLEIAAPKTTVMRRVDGVDTQP